jgi:hypothetical protein
MPNQAPIKLQQLKTTGVLDEERFYRLLSEQCNYISKEDVKLFYMGLVRLATQEIRKNGIVIFPHLGYFALLKQADKVGLFGKSQVFSTGKYVLKFYAQEKWRRYFSKFVEKRTGTEPIDPREHLLHEKL